MTNDHQQASVAIVDDHRLFASGLSLMLSGPPVNARTSVFSAHDEFIDETKNLDPGERWRLVVLDFYIPGTPPREMISQTRALCAEAAILVVSGSVSRSDRDAGLAAGADDFIAKSVDPDRLLDVAAALLSRNGGPVPSRRSDDSYDETARTVGLSPRQLEILVMAAQGLTNKEIAQTLAVSPETVKTHFAQVFRRFGVRNRIEAIDAARARGIA